MSAYVAFLRGMNVGGHRLTNAELRAHFAAIGFDQVATFRASGNVVFAAPPEQLGEIAARIERGLADALGYEVPTFVRSAPELRAIATLQPFDARHLRGSAGKLQVALLSEPPSKRQREAALALAGEGDRLAFAARELYWLPRGGILDAELDLKALGKLLGVMTLRTKSTIEQIAARHFAG
jgi:uncharacterized protein (DUF1697 family)